MKHVNLEKKPPNPAECPRAMGKRWSYRVRRVCQSSEKLASKCSNHSEIYRDQMKFGENSHVMQPSTRCSSCGFWSWSIVRKSENKKSDSGLIAWTETRPKRSDDRYDQEQITTGMKQDHEGLEVSRSCTLSGSSCKNLPVISILKDWYLNTSSFYAFISTLAQVTHAKSATQQSWHRAQGIEDQGLQA